MLGVSIGGWLDEEAVWNVDGDVNLLDRCARGERVYLLVAAPLLLPMLILM